MKWAWELGRARHVTVLARAAAASCRDGLRQALISAGGSWLDQPPRAGRALVLETGDRLAEGRLDGGARSGQGTSCPAEQVAAWGSHVDGYARHLVADLPDTLSTMRNNHLLVDALGMLVLERGLRDRGCGRCCLAAFASRIFQAQAAKERPLQSPDDRGLALLLPLLLGEQPRPGANGQRALGLALAGRAPTTWREEHHECAW